MGCGRPLWAVNRSVGRKRARCTYRARLFALLCPDEGSQLLEDVRGIRGQDRPISQVDLRAVQASGKATGFREDDESRCHVPGTQIVLLPEAIQDSLGKVTEVQSC